jgi:TRAP-type C4-dicarboxylate transport system substrate-binding protein
MALADKLASMNGTLKENYCAYKAMYDSLKPEDQKALDEAWAKGYSANVILNALRSEGIKSSNEAIRRHRMGACKCPKKTK